MESNSSSVNKTVLTWISILDNVGFDELEVLDSPFLYSGLLHCPEARGVTVLAETVFGKVIIWNGVTGDVINTLEGHDGVIFSVTYSGNTIVTTRDDRSSLVYTCGETVVSGGGDGSMTRTRIAFSIDNNFIFCEFLSRTVSRQ